MVAAVCASLSYDEFVRRRLDELRVEREREHAEPPPRESVDAKALFEQIARVEQTLEQRRRAAASAERARVLAAAKAARRTATSAPARPAAGTVAVTIPPPLPPPITIERSTGSPPVKWSHGYTGSSPPPWPMPPAAAQPPSASSSAAQPAELSSRPHASARYVPAVRAAPPSAAHVHAASRLQGLARGAHVRAALRTAKGAEMAEQLREIQRLLAEVAGKPDEADRLLARQLSQQLHRQQAELTRHVSRPLLKDQPRPRAPIRRSGALARTPRVRSSCASSVPSSELSSPGPACAGGADTMSAWGEAVPAPAPRRPVTAAAPASRLRLSSSMPSSSFQAANGRARPAHAIVAHAEHAAHAPLAAGPSPTEAGEAGGLPSPPPRPLGTAARASHAEAAAALPSSLRAQAAVRTACPTAAHGYEQPSVGADAEDGLGELGEFGGNGGYGKHGTQAGAEVGADEHAPPQRRHQFLRRRSTNPPLVGGKLDWSHVPARTQCRLAAPDAATQAAGGAGAHGGAGGRPSRPATASGLPGARAGATAPAAPGGCAARPAAAAARPHSAGAAPAPPGPDGNGRRAGHPSARGGASAGARGGGTAGGGRAGPAQGTGRTRAGGSAAPQQPQQLPPSAALAPPTGAADDCNSAALGHCDGAGAGARRPRQAQPTLAEHVGASASGLQPRHEQAQPAAQPGGRLAAASNRLSVPGSGLGSGLGSGFGSGFSSRSHSRRDSYPPSGSELPSDSLTLGELRHWCGILVSHIEHDMMETEQLREAQSAELPAGYVSLVPRIELTSRFWLYEDVLGGGFAHDDDDGPHGDEASVSVRSAA